MFALALPVIGARTPCALRGREGLCYAPAPMAAQWIGKCSHCAWATSGETFGGVAALADRHESQHAGTPRHLVTIARHPAHRPRRPPSRTSRPAAPPTRLRSR